MADRKYFPITAIIVYLCISLNEASPPADTIGRRDNKYKRDIENFKRNLAIPNRSSCGFQESDKSLDGFILGGREADINEFPWMVHLGYTNDAGDQKWACAGTLINPRYVLTAAHCVTGETIATVGKLKFVKLGDHNTRTDIDCNKRNKCNSKPIVAGVEVYTAHPNYKGSARSPNDIALIRINQKVDYTEFIRPICLPEPHESSNVGEKFSVAGWGQIENRTQSLVLRKVEIPFANQERCRRTYLSEGVDLENSQICAGGQEGKDSCIGDSGGPLMKRSKSNSFQWYQEGIVSFGFAECGHRDKPAVYTRIENFLPWIHSTVKE